MQERGVPPYSLLGRHKELEKEKEKSPLIFSHPVRGREKEVAPRVLPSTWTCGMRESTFFLSINNKGKKRGSFPNNAPEKRKKKEEKERTQKPPSNRNAPRKSEFS